MTHECPMAHDKFRHDPLRPLVILSLAILESLPGARLTVFLALSHARVAREQAVRFERGPEIKIHLEQRAGNAVPDSASLAERPAAAHAYLHIILGCSVSNCQRF